MWARGCDAVGPAPRGATWVDICDRGADAIEFLEYEYRHGRHFVIRAAKDRTLDGDDHVGSDRVHHRLLAYARDLPALPGGPTRTVAVPAVPGKHAARTATVAVASGPLRLRANRFARGECEGMPMDLWVIHVREVGTPAGVEPLEWVLLSDLPAETFAAASERLDWYEHRPVVEDYHKGQKTGLGIELPRLEDPEHLTPVVALLSVVAAVLLGLRDAGRQRDADVTPAAGNVVPPLYATVLAAHAARRARAKGPRAKPPVTADMSVREFTTEVAKLGGFLARKGDGSPGWQTLWRGWAALQLMVEGATAIIDERTVYL